jgi:hypothetical protein
MCSSILDFDVSPIFMLRFYVMVNMQFFDSCISFPHLVLVIMSHVICDLNAVHITPLLQILSIFSASPCILDVALGWYPSFIVD